MASVWPNDRHSLLVGSKCFQTGWGKGESAYLHPNLRHENLRHETMNTHTYIYIHHMNVFTSASWECSSSYKCIYVDGSRLLWPYFGGWTVKARGFQDESTRIVYGVRPVQRPKWWMSYISHQGRVVPRIVFLFNKPGDHKSRIRGWFHSWVISYYKLYRRKVAESFNGGFFVVYPRFGVQQHFSTILLVMQYFTGPSTVWWS